MKVGGNLVVGGVDDRQIPGSGRMIAREQSVKIGRVARHSPARPVRVIEEIRGRAVHRYDGFVRRCEPLEGTPGRYDRAVFQRCDEGRPRRMAQAKASTASARTPFAARPGHNSQTPPIPSRLRWPAPAARPSSSSSSRGISAAAARRGSP